VERFEFHGRIRRDCIQIVPDRFGPAGIRYTAADDVQVQLWDEITESGEVDFCAVKMTFDKVRDHDALLHNLMALRGRQVQQICAGYFRHQYEPRDQRVPVQQHVAVFQPAQEVAVGKQLLMYYELRQG